MALKIVSLIYAHLLRKRITWGVLNFVPSHSNARYGAFEISSILDYIPHLFKYSRRQRGRAVRALLAFWRPRVQVPPWPLTGFVHRSAEFRSSTTFVNSQLACLLPVGILNPVMFYLNICFSHLLGRPASISAINTAEGKNNAIIIIIII